MPRPKLPTKQKRDIELRIRFNEQELKVISKQAQSKGFWAVSRYIRSLIADDLTADKYSKWGMPTLEPQGRRKGL